MVEQSVNFDNGNGIKLFGILSEPEIRTEKIIKCFKAVEEVHVNIVNKKKLYCKFWLENPCWQNSGQADND